MRWFLRAAPCLLLLVLSLPGEVWAQSFPVYDVRYRPPAARYYVYTSRHFDMIYQEGLAEAARETAAILEAQLPAARALAGVRRRLRMPVVLNRFNDRANGFVTPFPFKQEIEGVAIKGGRLSARFSSWLWAVAPHELVHAAQGQAGGGLGVGTVVRWFAPDVGRSFNLLTAPGLSEGAAVYFESRVQPYAGRLHDGRFRMQFRAAMLSDDPWSLAQILEKPAYSAPSNRFYIGGAHFFQHLAEADSAQFFRRMMRLHDRFPFFGQGVELWWATGRSPRRIGRHFREAVRADEAARLAARAPLTRPTIIASGKGRRHRRPHWLDDSTLVAYVSGYDVRGGFYRLDARTGRRRLIAHESITEDLYFSLTPDSSALLFARYVPDPFVPIRAIGEIFQLDLKTGQTTRLTDDGRAFAPVETADGTRWALRNDGPFHDWIRLDDDGPPGLVAESGRATYTSLVPAPKGGPVAVLVNLRGYQGIFRATFEAGGRLRLSPWVLFEEAAIYDAAWSPDGRYLLFSADVDRVVNIFALDTHADRVVQLTNVAFGAMEPTLSPDGRTLAFSEYQHARYDLVRLPFAPEAAPEVPRALTQFGQDFPWEAWLRESPLSKPDATEPEDRRYRAWRHLAPRMLYPTLHFDPADGASGDVELGLGGGLAVQGADPLERWAYAAEGFYQDGRLWGRLAVQNAHTFLRPALTLFDEPETLVALRTDATGAVVDTLRVGREERGVRLGVQVPVVLESNVFFSQAAVALGARLEQARLFGPGGETLAPFTSRLRLTPSALFVYRLHSTVRDLVPNTGTLLAATASVEAWRERGARRRAVQAALTHHVSLSLRHHTALRLRAGLLSQNRGSIFDLDRFLPRGYENEFLGAGSFARLGAEVFQPLWYIDDGFVLVPLYFKALYVFGFAETVFPVQGQARRARFSATGAGLGLQLRFFYTFNFDLRFGLAYQLEEGRAEVVFR